MLNVIDRVTAVCEGKQTKPPSKYGRCKRGHPLEKDGACIRCEDLEWDARCDAADEQRRAQEENDEDEEVD